MTTAFSASPDLQLLEVVSAPEHQSIAGPAKTCATPEELARLPPPLAQVLAEGDSTLPDIRDLRKLVRRLPRLKRIVWTGRGGKGAWSFSKKSTSSILVNVTSLHAAISTLPTWHACQLVRPSFAYEDEPHGRVLEIPLPTAMHADLPTLSRSTTNSSSRTILHTPQMTSPILAKRDTSERRGSLITSPKSPSIPEMTCLTIDSKPKRAHGRSKSVSEVARPSPPHLWPPLAACKTPLIGSSGSREAAAHRRGQREDRLPNKASAIATGWARDSAAQIHQAMVGDKGGGILHDAARQVPGSGRTAGMVEKMEKRLRPKTQKVAEYVPIVEVAESDGDGEQAKQGVKQVAGWTTVVKEKSKEKKPAVVEIKSKLRAGKRAMK